MPFIAGIISTCTGMLFPFIFCFYGELATESSMQMTDALYESNWRKLPVNLQKYLIITIADMQKPIRYYGFVRVYLNLETFVSVSLSAIIV